MSILERWVQRTLLARGLSHEVDASRPDELVRLAASLGIAGGAEAEPEWWDEAVRLKDSMSLRELAEHLGVPVTQLTSEFRRRGVRKRVRGEDDVEEEEEKVPERRAGSKDSNVVQYYHLLGEVPDSEVAKMAGVSVRTIASYRARNDIPGYDGPRRRPAPRGRRQSKVDDFSLILGRVPDRVIADEAGMSLGAVRNFRIKQGILPAGRMTQAEIDRIIEDWRRGGAVPLTTGGGPPIVQPMREGQTKAWRCRLTGDAEGFVVVAPTLREAIDRAVSAAGDEARIAVVEQLGIVLDA